MMFRTLLDNCFMANLFTSLPTPATLKKQLPLLKKETVTLSFFRKTSTKILNRKERKIALIVGPCSIHDPQLALEYAHCLKALSVRVKKRIFIVMRVFLEKPRTHLGWKGFVYDPLLDGSYAMEKGLHASRKLLLALAQMGIPVATEFLDPIVSRYTEDLITWGIIGARTAASPIHRQMAAQLSMPIGFKNEMDGSIASSIYAALVARYPQTSIGIDEKGEVCTIQTCGNPHTHLILRGSQTRSNYDPVSIDETMQAQHTHGLDAPLLIDCAHGNSQKDPNKQPLVFQSVIEQIMEGNGKIAGMLLESHLKGGRDLSLTDPCLDWKLTEALILWAYHLLEKREENGPSIKAKRCQRAL